MLGAFGGFFDLLMLAKLNVNLPACIPLEICCFAGVLGLNIEVSLQL